MIGASPSGRQVTVLRIVIVAVVLATWETVSASGLLFRDVVPSLVAIGNAVGGLLVSPDFYGNLGITATEIGVGLLIGGISGLAVGIALGANRVLSNPYQSLVL